MFKCEDFVVYKLTTGELVTEEWTGKKYIQSSF
jgi:hypothetical protein